MIYFCPVPILQNAFFMTIDRKNKVQLEDISHRINKEQQELFWLLAIVGSRTSHGTKVRFLILAATPGRKRTLPYRLQRL